MCQSKPVGIPPSAARSAHITRARAEFSFDIVLPEVEYAVKPLFCIEVVYHPAEGAEREGVVDDVLHYRDAVLFLKYVLVAPEAVGPSSLLVYEAARLLDLGDLRHPGERYSEKGGNTIFNYHSLVYFATGAGDYFEPEPRGRDAGEVFGIGEKAPQLSERGRDFL